MILHTLNPNNYQPSGVLEGYNSLIWRDRYYGYGECEIITDGSAMGLSEGDFVSHSETDRACRIESITRKGNKVTLKGYGLEKLLDDRVLNPNLNAGGNSRQNFRIADTPGSAARRIVEKICINGADDTEDIIPELWVDDVTTDPNVKLYEIPPKSVYQALRDILEPQNSGFAITVQKSSPYLLLILWKGATKSDVQFGRSLDTYVDITTHTSKANFKNIAYVFAKQNTFRKRVAMPGASLTTSGLTRRVLMVDANDIQDEDMTSSELHDATHYRGLRALREHNYKQLVDGQISPYNTYEYREDYILGDSVYFVGDDGARQLKRVIEFTWTHNDQGLKRFPTFE